MAKEVKLTNKKRIWILRVITALASIAAVIAPVVTNKVNKDHEDKQLKEQHKQDIRKSNQEFAQNTLGFKHMIDDLKQQLKIKQEELDIAAGSQGVLTNDLLNLRNEIEQLKAELKRTKAILAYYVPHKA